MSPDRPEVDVRRSARRRRTVSAYRDGERIVVLVPASLSRTEERRWVDDMVERVLRKEQRERRRRTVSDADLMARARRLSDDYLGGLPVPTSVRWVDNQRARWGSCTPGHGTIRLSSRLQEMPDWVVDYVLVHELAHLLVPGHGAEFWEWVQRYPRAERARGWLDGWSAAARLDEPPGDDDEITD